MRTFKKSDRTIKFFYGMLENPNLSIKDVVIFGVIDMLNSESKCSSKEAIAKELNKSVRTVQRSLKKLKELDLIK